MTPSFGQAGMEPARLPRAWCGAGEEICEAEGNAGKPERKAEISSPHRPPVCLDGGIGCGTPGEGTDPLRPKAAQTPAFVGQSESLDTFLHAVDLKRINQDRRPCGDFRRS